jgi:hypothetical protein
MARITKQVSMSYGSGLRKKYAIIIVIMTSKTWIDHVTYKVLSPIQ